MTLILAIPAKDGIVMASDGQLTAGKIRSTGEKIRKLNDRCLWAASGELALIQRVEERLTSLPEVSVQQIRDQISNIVRDCVTKLIDLDFRTRFLPQQPDLLLGLHPGDFVFAEYAGAPEILHVLTNGISEWIHGRPFASGSGDQFAYALLQKYQDQLARIEVAKATLLAYKVMEEAIAVGAYGLGPPIHMWEMTSGGITKLDEAQIASLEDASRTLREAEVQLLIQGPNA